LDGEVGYATFGSARWVNQGFYRSKEWRDVRNFVIVRDEGNDMGIFDFPVSGSPHIHHMNPVTLEDIEYATDNLLNPEYLVCVSQRTHNAIHYGDHSLLPRVPVARSAGDTRLW
jgi:hypothetical protein